MMWAFALMLLGRPADACLWDDDTYATEKAGMPETFDVITGRFDRLPPAYYQRRIEIALKALSTDPDDLDAYDNAAVAHDRLGNPAAGLRLMEAKAEALDRVADPGEHQYRYLANRGTFLAHLALKEDPGLGERSLALLDEAARHIEDALALNPGAHFGREITQLQAIQWFRHAPRLTSGRALWSQAGVLGVDDWLQMTVQAVMKHEPAPEMPDAIRGLSGLIVLGAAWESVDIHIELSRALYASGNSSLGWMARLRALELSASGKPLLQQSSLSPDELQQTLQDRSLIITRDDAAVEQAFKDGRREAEAWRARRNAWVQEQLAMGLHPDTHPAFWSGSPE
jgi:tetratricopeptide (TPR) repeat protein